MKSYQVKIDMDNKSLLDTLTHIVVTKLGVNLGQVYYNSDIHIANSTCEKLQEFGFKTKIINNQ